MYLHLVLLLKHTSQGNLPEQVTFQVRQWSHVRTSASLSRRTLPCSLNG